jgi:hypothetical protein
MVDAVFHRTEGQAVVFRLIQQGNRGTFLSLSIICARIAAGAELPKALDHAACVTCFSTCIGTYEAAAR